VTLRGVVRVTRTTLARTSGDDQEGRTSSTYRSTPEGVAATSKTRMAWRSTRLDSDPVEVTAAGMDEL
jgi:hypothetical protein